MKKLGVIAFCVMILCAASAHAQNYSDQNPTVRSGGVGQGNYQSMEDSKNDYTFKAVFTGEQGIYLSAVDVSITDRRGEEVISNVTDGPMLLADLSPGRYTIHARAGDFEKTQKFSVGAHGLKTIYIRFPIRDQDTQNNRRSENAPGYAPERQPMYGAPQGNPPAYNQNQTWTGHDQDDGYPN